MSKNTQSFYDKDYCNKRNELPYPKKEIKIHIMQILKDSIGKDLSHFCTPVYLNEPLSMLQRLTENYQYSHLLNRAAKEQNQYIRISLIGAFGLSAFAFNQYRTLKSFNPILGETYEFIDNDQNMRIYCEQVSHHPPISACFAEGDGFNIYSNTHAETKFMLLKGCIEFAPVGKTFVNLLNFGETYSFTKPRVSVKNLIFGRMRLECYGKLEVVNKKTGDILNMEMFEESTKHAHGSLSGEVKNIQGEVFLKIEGNCFDKVDIIHVNKSGEDLKRETIWNVVDEENSQSEQSYFFTKFMCNLNNLNDDLKILLPPTDSRFRPDQRALEEQNIELAEEEKKHLEKKQREARKLRERNNVKYEPMYFKEEFDNITGELIFIKSGDYWKDRKEKNFLKFKDIFGR